MRAAIFEKIGAPLSIATVPDPILQAGQAILKVAFCGVCGSDLHMSDQPGALGEGTILGHEFAGTILESRANVALRLGARVTALPLLPCWSCADCEDHYHIQCSDGQYVGIGRPGAFADYVIVDVGMIQQLPDGISFQEGALVEPLAVAHHAIRQAGPLAGRDVLILGGGPIGVAVTLFAARSGARNIIVSEPSAGRRLRAKILGASAVLDPTTENIGERAHQLCGKSADVVIECVGAPGMIGKAIEYVAKRGRVVVLGACLKPDSFAPVAALIKAVTIIFSSGYQVRDFEGVINSIAKGEIDAERLVTSMIGLAALPDAFEALKKPSEQCKLLVNLDG